MTVRFSPSLVSYERDLSRPVAITRVPRCSDSAMFSAASRQMEQRMKRVSPSFHSLDCRSNVRGVDATVKFATAAPEGVNRSSGSAVRLPTMVMVVSPAMGTGDSFFVLVPTVRWDSTQAPGRMSLVRMTDSFRPSWRSSSLAVAGSEVKLTTA